jgi:hypothetical protein
MYTRHGGEATKQYASTERLSPSPPPPHFGWLDGVFDLHLVLLRSGRSPLHGGDPVDGMEVGRSVSRTVALTGVKRPLARPIIHGGWAWRVAGVGVSYVLRKKGSPSSLHSPPITFRLDFRPGRRGRLPVRACDRAIDMLRVHAFIDARTARRTHLLLIVIDLA